jgi:ABC-2 type transport system permease protein
MNIRATVAAFKQQAIHFIADPQWIIPSIVAPFVFAVVALFIYGGDDGSVVLQAVIGGGVLGMWGNTIFGSGYSISYDRYNGTVEPIMLSPSNLADVIAGRSIWNTFIGLINALLVFAVAELMFHTGLTVADPIAFFAMLVLTLGSLACIGLMFSACFIWTRRTSALFAVLEFPIYILSGAMVPVSVLPEGLRYISYVLPPSWGVDALKLSALGGYPEAIGTGILTDTVIMLALMIVYVIAAAALFRIIERNVRISGSLTRY